MPTRDNSPAPLLVPAFESATPRMPKEWAAKSLPPGGGGQGNEVCRPSDGRGRSDGPKGQRARHPLRQHVLDAPGPLQLMASATEAGALEGGPQPWPGAGQVPLRRSEIAVEGDGSAAALQIAPPCASPSMPMISPS